MLTRIADWKFPCVYIHVYRITKNRGPGPYNPIQVKSKGSTHLLLGKGSRKIWTCSC